MIVLPAIDIRGGRCVRLHQGDFGHETVYSEDPVQQARAFDEAGAQWIHVVDLDAARTGEARNLDVVAAVAGAVTARVQSGGGVRSVAAAERLFRAGVDRVVIGTAAVTDPAMVAQLAADHEIAVGIDARGGEVATDGWLVGSGRTVREVVEELADVGVAAFVVTDIARDGTLDGPDTGGLGDVLAVTDRPVIASGGVGSLADLVTLAALEVEGRTLSGAIVGKAIYEGRVELAEALALTGGPR